MVVCPGKATPHLTSSAIKSPAVTKALDLLQLLADLGEAGLEELAHRLNRPPVLRLSHPGHPRVKSL